MKPIDNKISYFLLVLLSLLLLSSCSNEFEDKIKQNYQLTNAQVEQLGNKLDSQSLTNAKLVSLYAQKLSQIKPDLEIVANSLAKDATRQGTLYQGLKSRLKKVNQSPENKQQFNLANDSLSSVYAGSDPIVFNDSLLDLINTMADLSAGQLARISIPKNSQTEHVKGEKIVPGSYLVGNPSYGQYQQNSSGQTFWHWYGQYAFFSSLFSGSSYYNRPLFYDRWNSHPRYSYYNDYGRSAYGSSRDRTKTQTYNKNMQRNGVTPAKPKKQYGSVQGRKKTSTYSRNRSNAINNMNRKYGSSSNGPRHFGKENTKKSSSFFGGNRANKQSSTSSTYKPSSKRSSSFFGNSSRSSYSRSSFSRGGK